jgi:putative flavoprotein involved in K+ transport
VGEHVRVPRIYRGKDIQWWMDASGVLDERYDQVDDIVRARNVPSLQLAGYPERRTIDLNSLTAIGVKLVGRLAGINGGKAQFSGALRNHCAMADLKTARLLDRTGKAVPIPIAASIRNDEDGSRWRTARSG